MSSQWAPETLSYSDSKMFYHLRAIFIGVVRQEVKRSAGSSGFIGSSSVAPQAASWIQFFVDDGGLVPLLNLPFTAWKIVTKCVWNITL